MDLREALARRMSHVTRANPLYPNHVYDEDWELYLRAADEALRQMEWARRDLPLDCTVDYAIALRHPLTLAPEDWSPNADLPNP